MNSTTSTPVILDTPERLFTETPGNIPRYLPIPLNPSLNFVLGESFPSDFRQETSEHRAVELPKYGKNSPLFHVRSLGVDKNIASITLQRGPDFVDMVVAQTLNDVKALLPSVLAANIFLRTPDGRYVVFPRNPIEYKALAGLVVASEESGVPTLMDIIRQRLQTEKIGDVRIGPETAIVRGLLFYSEKREIVIDIEMPISEAVLAAIQGINNKVQILTEDQILSGEVTTLAVTGILIQIQNRLKCIHLLQSIWRQFGSSYPEMVQTNIDGYIDFYLKGDHSAYSTKICSWNQYQVLEGLRKCTQKKACGFYHEFHVFNAVPHSPPFDKEGLIDPPDTCSRRADNANCPHSNVLLLMLRALTLIQVEGEKALDYLRPFFYLLIQDALFSSAVRSGNQGNTMDTYGLAQQEALGGKVMEAISNMIQIMESP